jgi:8-oxo-dGTP pyrophosphatase MutT (NUDIX family)
VTGTAVRFVDVYVLRDAPADPRVLVLRRAPSGGRSPATWEAVHGAIEPGETAVQAALRELTEETGLAPARFYNASRVEAFYRHVQDEVCLIPVFVAVVAADAAVRVSAEHDAFEWLAPEAAAARVAWPRMRRALEDALALFGKGGGNRGGLLDDVLRVC